MALIELRDVKKTFRLGDTAVPALRGVNLTVEKGEFPVLSGPSGSGKTTLLNILGCLESPTSGVYRLDGHEIAATDFDALAPLRHDKLGFVFQNFNLIPVLDVWENIEFPLLLSAIGEAGRKHRVGELIEAMGLQAHVRQRPQELSGGQRQRVAIARALAMRPPLVLADEPTANLDSTNTTQILDLMKTMNEREGVTFLFSSHDPRVVERASRVIEICDGIIAA